MPKSVAVEPSAPARGRARLLPLLGPAMVAGVAYLDPGNVAANLSAGAGYGMLLLWVVVAGNLTAWLIQYLSAKLGLVTGTSLAGALAGRFRSPWTRRAYWLQGEAVAMATDVAEIIGGAVALWLLFGIPLPLGGLITGLVSMVLLVLHRRRRGRLFEFVITGLIAVIVVGFGAGLLLEPPAAAEVLPGLVPRFEDTGSVLLAASILGATVMPHAIYAHSALVRDRFAGEDASGVPSRLRATRIDVTIALVIAGGVNAAMLILAATALRGVDGTDTLEGAHAALEASLGAGIAALFAVGLLASGLASTSVGAYAGAEIMGSLLRRRIPLLLRRTITLLPALAILGLGVDPTGALVASQVVLSFGIPFALIPLVVLTARRSVMGGYANRAFTTGLASLAALLLVALNITLLVLLVLG